ncbi:CrcB family protein [Corynebacterium kutscheri]|uniref:CrcB family protein n=1 Tax=Corynebacterium kutscheri TaxID=35755 RepID=UPI001559351F|nr:CrcB family protein [Corynebacterium kutscheri]
MVPLFLIGIGAGCGALIRYAIELIVTGIWVLFIINISGSFLMGIAQKKSVHPALTTGFLGGFTSYSTFLVYASTDFSYCIITIISCVSAWWIGQRCSR